MRRLPVLVALVLFSAAPAAAAAPEDVANTVAQEVMSPYCTGVTLHDCPSSSAQEMRAEIVAWAEDGMTKEQILDRLEAEFGPSIRALPPAEGSGLLAWLLPGVAVLAGAVLAIVLARRWARRAPAVAAPAAPVSAEAGARLNAELDRLRRES
ncbi:MAG TPA: cytochrome c-type biogenesis protein CcmH [Actinomycetota bacterium]|nr:cytochrome c-type biogenesis protein CcmH [Actinomycetota bacterium]